jgi:hypothetical protein
MKNAIDDLKTRKITKTDIRKTLDMLEVDMVDILRDSRNENDHSYKHETLQLLNRRMIKFVLLGIPVRRVFDNANEIKFYVEWDEIRDILVTEECETRLKELNELLEQKKRARVQGSLAKIQQKIDEHLVYFEEHEPVEKDQYDRYKFTNAWDGIGRYM